MRKPKFSAPMTIPELSISASQIAQWLKWEVESLAEFHEYAQRFGCAPGTNVYAYVLNDALAHRGMTLDQFRAAIRDQRKVGK